MKAYLALSPRRQRFVDAYVQCGVGAEAARQAGYSAKNPKRQAFALLQTPGVREAIQEREQEAVRAAGVTLARTLQELAAVAFLDVGNLYTDTGTLKALKEMSAPDRRAIRSMKVQEIAGIGATSACITEVRLHDKVAALEKLLKHLGGMVDRHEVAVVEMTPEEKARRIAFLLASGMVATAPAAPHAAG